MDARLLLAVAAVPALAAGCGAGGGSAHVASVGTGATTTGASKPIVPLGGSFQKFVTCMRRHGVQAQLGPQGHGVALVGTPDKTAAARAQTACQTFLPGGGPPALTPAERAAQTRAMVALARCMRRNGVPSFPDPDAQGQLVFSSRIDKSSPAVQSALAKCGKLMPRIRGPKGG